MYEIYKILKEKETNTQMILRLFAGAQLCKTKVVCDQTILLLNQMIFTFFNDKYKFPTKQLTSQQN